MIKVITFTFNINDIRTENSNILFNYTAKKNKIMMKIYIDVFFLSIKS